MTTKPAYRQLDAEAGEIVQFPEPPPEEMTGYYSVSWQSYPESLAQHFGHPETTIITSEVAAALMVSPDRVGVRYPDLLIAFNVNPAANRARMGYLIPEQGKPPDFVLEVASKSTGERDETTKRENYASMGVPEYWRFDETGGEHHSVPLAGDRLLNGVYVPIPIHRADAGYLWGRSASLNLDLCWENGILRFRDPATGLYIATFAEERAAHRQADARADAEAAARRQERAARLRAEAERDAETATRRQAEAERDAETAARRQAEARARQLEAELRRRQNP